MPLLESFRATRWVRLTNLVLQAVLVLTLFGGLNYLAGNHPWRFDLTRYRRYTLSPETVAYLRDLNRPVQIVVTKPEGEVSPELLGLLREYVYATEGNANGQVSVRYLDIYVFRKEAESLGIDQPGVIWLRCGDKARVLQMDELYRVENGERQAFQGEQTITSAILDVSNPKPNDFRRGIFRRESGHTPPNLRKQIARLQFQIIFVDECHEGSPCCRSRQFC